MAFLKTAITSLGLLFASSAYAQGNGQEKESLEARAVSLEQIFETSKEAAWKIAVEKGRLQSETEESKGWIVKLLHVGVTATGMYKIPKGITLQLDGSLEGYGLRLNAAKGNFFCEDLRLKDLSGSKDVPIDLSGENVGTLLENFDKNKNSTKREVETQFNNLERDLKDIYGEEYSGELFKGLFIQMVKAAPRYSGDDEMTISDYSEFYKDMGDFLDGFYQKKVSLEDKERTAEVLDDFVVGMRNIKSTSIFWDVIQKAYEDPMNEVSIGGKTLKELEPLFENLKPLLNIEESEKGLKVDGWVEGSGNSEVSSEAKYDLGLGREFTQSFSAKGRVRGYAGLYLDMGLSKGEPIYVYVTEDKIKIPLETIGDLMDFPLNLLDLDLEGLIAAEYKLLTRVREGYQFLELTEDGSKGYGLVLDRGSMDFEAFKMEVQAKLNSHENMLGFSFTQTTKVDKRFHERLLFYTFREGQKDTLWYYLSAGVEPYLEQRVYQEKIKTFIFESELRNIFNTKLEKKNSVNGSPNPKIHLGLRPQYSFAFGSKGKIINPFLSYATTPDELARAGMILDIGPVVSRFYLQSSVEDSYSLESGVIFFDEDSDGKLTDYYIRSEQIAVSPASGKSRALTNAQTELYSNISGLLLNGKLLNEDYLFRVVLGSENAYMGATYFGNYKEEMHGIGVLFGYNDFSASLEGGMSELGGMHSRQLRVSIGGSISNISIYLDFRTSTWPLGRDAYDRGIQDGTWPVGREMYYFDDQNEDILGTFNIKGVFQEEVWLEYLISRWVKPSKVEKKRSCDDLEI